MDGYSSEVADPVTENGDCIFTVTNTYTPGVTSISVKKEWNDGNNRDGLRPASITVKLYANGEEVADKVQNLSEEKQ